MSTIQFRVRRRDLAWATALVVLLSAIWVARGDQADAGVTPPPGTGIAVVYIAVGTNYPDALGVGPGAGVNGAPIIIVPTAPPIPTPTSAELVRLDPRSVQIVGGTGVISQAMEDALKALLPNATFPTRIAGGDRYETNALFSQANFPVEEWVSVPAVAFNTSDPSSEAAYRVPGAAYSSLYILYAPISLPDGAEVLEMRALVYDGTDASGMTVQMGRSTFGGIETIFEITTGTPYNGGNLTSSDSIPATGTEVVDNESYSYIVTGIGTAIDKYIVNVMVRYRLGAP